MLQNLKSLMRMPQNDAELNVISASLNRANGKYLDAAFGKSRSNNLRDCTCEFLGFTNGAYRELQAFWSAQSDYDFTDLKTSVTGIIFEPEGGYTAVIATPLIQQFMKHVCSNFPADSSGLLTEDEAESFDPNLSYETWGWEPLHYDGMHQSVIREEKDQGNWFALYFEGLTIGFAFTQQHADFINGILLSASTENAFSLPTNTNNAQWNNYVAKANRFANDSAKVLSLRKTSMQHGIYISFDSLIIDEARLVLTSGVNTITVPYNAKEDVFEFAGLKFDFNAIYALKDDATISLTSGEADLAGNANWSSKTQRVEFIEWFAKDRLEYRHENEDDILSYNHLEGAAFIVE